ncbi:MAG TPA: GNAT family N-acetyltransferase, partial [Waddliaceae bacterium]
MQDMPDTLDKIVICPMRETDIDIIAVNHCPPWSTVEETKGRWHQYYKEQQEGTRTVGVVEQEQKILGYGSLFLKSEYSHFPNIPEINDLWIYEEYRGKGAGSRLIGWLEELARRKGYKQIGIGVGLYSDYGS